MMPDLGKYAADVLMAYGIGLFLLLFMVAVSLKQSAKAKKMLDAQEQRTRDNG